MKFNYQARTKDGDIQAGSVEAASQEAALKVLQSYELVVTFLEKASAEPFYSRSLTIFQRISRKDLVLFSRELATMFKADVTLMESLRTIAEETKNLAFKEKILKLSEKIEGGTSFSDALSDFPNLFSPFYINLVKSGELSGKLSDVLEYLADHLERDYDFTQKITAMMMYPAVVLVVFIGVLLAMTIKVIPSLVEVLEFESYQLPMITKIVIAFSDIIRKYFLLIIVGGAGIAVAVWRFRKTPAGKKWFDNFLLKVPVINTFLKTVYLSRFSENLSTLTTGGLPIAKALEISAKVVNNSCFGGIILEACEEVRRGGNISLVFKKYPKLIPPFFSQMVSVGEKTGTLSTVLLGVSGFYQKETERSAEILLSLLEPLMIVILGGAVGVLIAAVLLPMYQGGMAQGG
ncbi:MAG: type II secretion system F family protein [bacterium]|nr:type II secretion system F family protein [bacterium]